MSQKYLPLKITGLLHAQWLSILDRLLYGMINFLVSGKEKSQGLFMYSISSLSQSKRFVQFPITALGGIIKFVLLTFSLTCVNNQQLYASDIDKTNCISQTGTGYDANRGFYHEFKIKYYDNSGTDDGIVHANFWFVATSDGDMTDIKAFSLDVDSNEGGDDVDFKITSYNGFYIGLRAESYPSWSYVKYGSGTLTDHSNTDGDFYAYVRVYLKQDLLNHSTVSWDFLVTSAKHMDLFKVQSSLSSTNDLPSLTSVTASLNPQDGFYDINFNTSSGMNKTGVAKVYQKGASSKYSSISLGSNLTTGKITESASFLSSALETRTAVLDLTWAHAYSGYSYSLSKEVTLTHLRNPVLKSLTATNNSDGTVRLTWGQTTGTTGNTSPYTDGWVVSIFFPESTTWSDLSPEVVYQSSASTKYSYSYNLPDSERMQGNRTYQFAVRRSCLNSDVLTADHSFSEITSVTIQTNYEKPSQITFDNSSQNLYIKVTPGMKPDNLEHIVTGFVVKTNASIPGLNAVAQSLSDDDPKKNEGYSYYLKSNIESCTPSRFEVQTRVDGSSIPGYMQTLENAMYKPNMDSEFLSFTASKGYYNDHVDLHWTTDPDKNNFSYFLLNRYMISDTIVFQRQVAKIKHDQLQTEYYIQDDNTSGGLPPAPGTYYRYELQGFVICDEVEEGVTQTLTDIGFAEAQGTISGKVTMSNGTAVKDVDIIFTNADKDEYNPVGANKSLDFGPIDSVAWLELPTPYVNESNNLTIQFYAKIREAKAVGEKHQLFLGGDTLAQPQLELWLDSENLLNMKIFGNPSVKLDEVFPQDCYFQFSGVLTHHGGNYNLDVYLNGNKIGNMAVAESRNLSFKSASVSGKTPETKLDGLLDELRIWTRDLSVDEILKNHNRYVSVKTSRSLRAYYRFNEPNYVGNQVFDASFDTDYEKYNQNHATYNGMVSHNTDDVPSEDQLAFKVQTDEDGNYNSSQMLPFKNSGTTYLVKPVFGVHEFNPGNKTRTISINSSTHSGVDFIDVSSFPVSIAVTYANSNYPVDSVMVSIDGIVASKDGEAVMTNKNGEVTVDVPIGSHFITISKQGHTFAGGGRFPKNELEKYNFQSDDIRLKFYDQTTVRLAGRVAGGHPQTDLTLGFGLSNANIGQATITLKTDSNYRLNLSDSDSISTTQIGGKESTITFKSLAVGSEIQIKTNDETGEFLAELPPVPYKLAQIATKDYMDNFTDNDEVDFSYGTQSISMNPNLIYTNSYTNPVTKIKQSFTCNDSLIITRYEEPVIIVEDLNAASGAFGDSVFVYTNQTTGAQDSITLYSKNSNGTIVYKLGVPVFTQKMLQYDWKVTAFESYVNNDETEAVVDIVPLEGNTVGINNALASMRVDIDTTTSALETTLSEVSEGELVLDTAGVGYYSFKVGFPNINGDHKLAAQFTLTQNGKSYSWEQSGILFGQLPSDGNNFVTKGPDAVDIVLHDPAGSNSYAYIAKGSSYTKTFTRSDVITTTQTEEVTIHISPKIEMGTGFGVIFMSEIKTYGDIELNSEQKEVITRNNEQQITTTFNQQISTSSDPNYVGAMADVYIGKSTNLVYGKMRQLALYPSIQDESGTGTPIENDSYRLFTKEVLTANQEFGTIFSYSQTYLINSQIPYLKTLRNQLINPITDSNDTLNIIFGDDKAKYFSFLPMSDPNFGAPKTYYVFFSPNAAEQERIDEVQDYNTWIANWEQRIADNEKAKLDLFEKRDLLNSKKDEQLFENISYDAGVSLEKSLEVSYNNIEITESSFSAEGSLGAHTGYAFNNIGLEGHVVIGAGRDQTNGESSENGNLITFGYAISEDESVLFAGNDALSIDIFGPSSDNLQAIVEGSSLLNLSGFTFRTRAGQTSCPYEPSDSTIYYTDSHGEHLQLNYGTFQIENAQLHINSKNVATADNIPSGRSASFTLQMQNNSEANLDVTYQLSVDGSTNPDGLILLVDGEPLTSPRQYRINTNEQITKTLIVRQTSTDILDYNNIAIRLGSVCENENYSEAYVNAHFIPSSSDVSLSANATLLNNNTAGKDGNGKFTLTIGDYDKSFKNFGCIRLQYRKTSEESWTSLKTYVIDESLIPIQGSSMMKIEDAEQNGRINYDFSYSTNTPSDGDYIFRALTVSENGNEEITLSSNEIDITKDMRSPQLLGNTLPANGILNPEDEISITFSEDIQADVLTNSNFSIKGVLNASVRKEPTVGLAFDGTGLAYTEQPISTNESFSIETWFRRELNTAGTLFSYGENDNYISLGFDAEGHAVVTIGQESQTSIATISNITQTWKYIGLSYNLTTKTVSVYEWQDSDPPISLFETQSFSEVPASNGKLYVGNNSTRTDGFHGAVGLLHFYAIARSQSDMSDSKFLTKSGNEPNLIGLWEMEEGEGTIAEDKARSRNLLLNTSWYLYPEGKSLTFNGTGDYATIPSDSYSFGQYNDFTWEFWFKAKSQSASTILSAGESAYVGFDSDGKMVLLTEKATQILAPAGLLDDEWHHFALSVKRTGTTNAMIDGNVTASFSSSIFSGAVRGVNCIGAKWKTDLGIIQYSDYFNGNIDELRVWDSALTTKNIVLDKNHKLRGTEDGLLAYYPFEAYDKQDQIYMVYERLNDMVDPSLSVGNVTTTSNVAAPMQDCLPVTDVRFTFTASDRKIVFDITEDDYKVEGVTLQVNARDILDVHNNKSTSYRWTAYVNRNPLKWNSEPVKLVAEQGSPKNFNAIIVNRGGENTAYYIENIPSWLTVSSASGILQPSSLKELIFSVADGINIGSYEASIVLTGDNNVREILQVTLKVTGQRPNWTVDPGDFEQSMTVTGQLLVEGYPQEDEDDLLAAFIGDKCVGLISPSYNSDFQTYFVFMTIWGNSANNGDEVAFKLWDASTGQIYPVIELKLNDEVINVSFAGDDMKGSADIPVKFNARNVIEQSIDLGKGWNWISENIENDNPTIIDQFKVKSIDFATQLKANGGQFINNSGGNWVGTVSSLSSTKGYLVKTSQSATLILTGKAVSSTKMPISLAANKWSWIGYTPQMTMSVKTALAGIGNPLVGDQIKGQKGYRIMTSNGWIGSLSLMEPGRGYMYRSTNSEDVSFYYPSTSSTTKSAFVNEDDEFIVDKHWSADCYHFATNMTITASVFIDTTEVKSGLYEVAAFCGDDCRGSALLKRVDGFEHPFMGFLMVYGDTDDPLKFRIYNHTTGQEYDASEQLSFKADSIYGTPDKLYVLNSLSKSGPVQETTIQIYPNPVTTTLNISYDHDKLDKIEVIDLCGRILWAEKDFTGSEIHVSDLESGVYVLNVMSDNKTTVYRFIKK